MPQLNPDILKDVFIECLQSGSRALGKFILSGREEFYLTLNYFKKAVAVRIDENGFGIVVKDGKYVRTHLISYQFSMNNLIKEIVRENITEIVVEARPKFGEPLKYFLTDKIKKVTAFHGLSKEYQNLIQQRQTIECIQIKHFGYDTGFSMIPSAESACTELMLTDFVTAIPDCYLNNILSHKLLSIEKLEISGIYCNQESFALFIISCFPNLEVLNATFVGPKWWNYNLEFKHANNCIADFQSFSKTKIHGTISFHSTHSKAFDRALTRLNDLTDAIIDNDKKVVTKIVQLKNDLKIKYVFGAQND